MVENKIDVCENKEESIKITKEGKQKSLLLGLLKVVSKIIENLEGREVLEEETAEKGTNILLKLLKAILTLNKVFTEVKFYEEDEEEYKFGAADISIMEDYIAKLKREKIERGEMVW
jgi:hypothetical protein